MSKPPTTDALERARNLVRTIRSGQDAYFADEVERVLDAFSAERERALEEAAKIADGHEGRYSDELKMEGGTRAAFANHRMAARNISLEIRALKGKP